MRELVLATVAVAALWWPGRIAGLLDGAPLTGQVEAILLGFVAPALWWFHRSFFRSRAAQVGVAAIVILKIAAAFPAQEGWCVRFDPHRPIVRDSTGRPHSWDVRADWRSPNPSCSAVMTTPYTTFKEFPAWFFNLPPIDNNLPSFEDRPPGATTDLTVVGFINATDSGLLEIVTGPGMAMTLVVDGQPADHPNELSHRVQLTAGIHFVQASGTLTENHWQFMPSWNRALFGSSGFPTATLARPGTIDRPLMRRALGWLTTLVILAFVLAWVGSAFLAWSTRPIIAWTVVASVVLGYVAPRAGNQFVTSSLAGWSIASLALAAFIPIAPNARKLRTVFVLIGVPWLVFVAVGAIDHAGRFSLYAGGDDMWTYQRFAYRVYLQGYWLEGGQATFWFQPLYRWISGGLHMLFGDSSIGEYLWDGASLLAAALFAHEACARVAGFRWGLAAATLSLVLFMNGTGWEHFGIGLSENAATGLMYMAALTAISTERMPGTIAAGILATLSFYTRLNNLPMALAIAAFATSWRRAAAILGTVATGVFLFALRTWYYTGVFSVFHGTQFGNLAVWQAGLPFVENVSRMFGSAWMVLAMSDPPVLKWYAVPLFAAVLVSIAVLARVSWLRALPISLAIFFLAGWSGSLVARGTAYSGRFSTIMIGAACAVCVSAAAVLLTHFLPRFGHRTAGS
jgi:hypothetical protein